MQQLSLFPWQQLMPAPGAEDIVTIAHVLTFAVSDSISCNCQSSYVTAYIIIIMLPNQAIASTPSAPRPSGAEGRLPTVTRSAADDGVCCGCDAACVSLLTQQVPALHLLHPNCLFRACDAAAGTKAAWSTAVTITSGAASWWHPAAVTCSGAGTATIRSRMTASRWALQMFKTLEVPSQALERHQNRPNQHA
jgi:hypothetical protein